MDGLMGGLEPAWDALSSGLSRANLLTAVMLGLLIGLHIIIVRSVVRPTDAARTNDGQREARSWRHRH